MSDLPPTPPYRSVLIDPLLRWHHSRRHTIFIGNPPHKASNLCAHRLWCWLAEVSWTARRPTQNASLRKHCEVDHDLKPESNLDHHDLVAWHHKDHTVIKTHSADAPSDGAS